MGYIAKIIFKIHTLAKGLFFGLMVTTAWMAYRVCESAIGGSIMLTPIQEAILVSAAALAVTYLIDNALYENSVAALAQAIEHGGPWKLFKKGGVATLVLLVLMAGRFFFSGGATYLTGESTVAERQASPEHDYSAEIRGLQSDKNAAIQQVRTAKMKEAQNLLDRADKLAEERVEVAIKQGSPREQKAYRNGQWVRASYSISIKKAEKEAYSIRQDAEKKYNAVVADMRREIDRISDDPAWEAGRSEISKKAEAAALLYFAERWTYYLIDFILVVGGFLCSFLVAFHIVESDDTIETFFPDKPGLLDIVVDSIGSVYTYLVTMIAQIPAHFKEQGSKRMVQVAKSVGKSSASYHQAIAEYIVASHPTVRAQAGAIAQQAAMQRAQQQAQQAQQKIANASAPPNDDEQESSNCAAQQGRNSHNESATGAQQGRNTGATAAQQPQRKKSGASFRSYLSRAGQAYSEGHKAQALSFIEIAKQVVPDDHNKPARLEKLRELQNLIENGQ